MIMLRPATVAIAAAGALFAPAAWAQSARATLTVQPSVGVGAVRTVQMSSLQGPAARPPGLTLRAQAPGVVQIVGDPGRVYRIAAPQSLAMADGAILENLRIWSANAGDVSLTHVAHTDLGGRDLLTISGKLRTAPGDLQMTASRPFEIDYE